MGFTVGFISACAHCVLPARRSDLWDRPPYLAQNLVSAG